MRDSKLSPNYEPGPYVVVHKDGNAVVLQDVNGNSKMCNIAHMKKFVEPATTEMEESSKAEQPETPEQTVEPMQHKEPEATVSQPSSQSHLALPSDSPGDSDTSRPVRVRHAPAWMKYYVCK